LTVYFINNLNIVTKVKISEIRPQNSCVALSAYWRIARSFSGDDPEQKRSEIAGLRFAGWRTVIPGLGMTITENPCHPPVGG
jgi:hypothetical protein